VAQDDRRTTAVFADASASVNDELVMTSESRLGGCARVAKPEGGVSRVPVARVRRSARIAVVTTAFAVVGLLGASSAWAQGWSGPIPADPIFSASSISCPSSSFCLAVATSGVAATYNGSGWSAPTAVQTAGYGPDSVSCVSSSFCVAVGVGYATTFNGTSWSTPVALGSRGEAVSCASTSFCMAVDFAGEAFVYNGSSWSAPTIIDAGTSDLDAVSCPTSTFCMAIDDGGKAMTYNAGTWSTPTSFEPALGNLNAVSCMSATQCMVVDGGPIRYSAGVWTTMPITSSRGLDSVSCVTTGSFCAATGPGGNAYTYSGGTWSPGSLGSQTSGYGPSQVACASASFCAAVAGGIGFTYAGASWSAPAIFSSVATFNTISCVSVTFCLGGGTSGLSGQDGNSVTFNGTSWSAPMPADSGTGGLTNVSCVSSSFCVGIGDATNSYPGDAFIYDGHAWGPPSSITGLDAVSCVSTAFCAAVTGSGRASIYNGTTFGPATPVDAGGSGLHAISCASTSFCVATDPNGIVFIYSSGSWSGGQRVDPHGSNLISISCPTTSFCVAVDQNGQGFTYNGSSWSAGTTVDNTGNLDLNSVSCTGPTFCAAVNFDGVAFTYDGTTWTPYQTIAFATVAVSCSSSTFCVAIDRSGHALTFTGAPTPPTISFVGPAGGATVSGTVALSATAIDAFSSITGVSFSLGGTSLGSGTLSSGAWSRSWDSTTVGNGSYQLSATATAANGTTTTTTEPITVNNVAPPSPDTTPPVVTLTTPVVVSGVSTQLTATATDNVAVQSVSFKLDSTDLGLGTFSAPSTYTRVWDSTSVPNGTYTLIATATDTSGNTKAATEAITVNNPVCPSGQTGTYPTCQTPATPCPAGTSGPGQPSCTPIQVACPTGYSGTPPNCTKVVLTCPAGEVGSPPACAKPSSKQVCIVPRLKGKTLSQARALLMNANCRLGKVTKPTHSKRHAVLIVGSQSVAPGRQLARGSAIRVTLVARKKHG
jgi:hypothetical protein